MVQLIQVKLTGALAAFQLQSAHFASVSPQTGSPQAGCMLLADLN
eukprot:SAG25_NODE_12466_length_279_cov_8.572222_1_plen_44_part_01